MEIKTFHGFEDFCVESSKILMSGITVFIQRGCLMWK